MFDNDELLLNIFTFTYIYDMFKPFNSFWVVPWMNDGEITLEVVSL